MLKRNLLASLVAAALGVVTGPPALAQADTSDSQRVGNLAFGNALDPTGWAAFTVPDPLGMSWLHPGQFRTPSGVLYPYPWKVREDDKRSETGWTWAWLLQLGYTFTSGDADNAFLRQYADWQDGPVLGFLAFSGSNPETGSYVEFRGSRISGDDQYYRLRAGRHGLGRFEAFHREIPHTLSTTAYPLWNGVGSTRLTLPEGLPTGASQEQVRAVMKNRPRRTLTVNREGTGVSWEGTLTRHWIAYAGVSHELREGQRRWGGPMYLSYFFSSPGPGGVGTPAVQGNYSGQYGTVRPVDFSTTDMHLGLRNKGGARGWLFDFSFNGSFFRNHKDHLSWEVPFAVVPGVTSVINGGTWSLEPDNDYYNLRLEAAHPLSLWHGRFSATAAWASMRQDDALRPPLSPAFCPDGQYIGASGIACADWNTTAALSRSSAQARIDTLLVKLRADFRPTRKLSWHAQLRRHDEDNQTRYTMYNPLTGQYGYVPESGSLPLVIPLPRYFRLFDADDPAYRSVYAQVRNIPFEYDRASIELGGSYRYAAHSSLSASYRLKRRSPKLRERRHVTEQRLELDWDTRILADAALRTSYKYLKRSGGAYNHNPYLGAYSVSLPGYVLPEVGYTAYTVAQMHKYDLSDLQATKLKAILIAPLGTSATLSASVHGHWRDYNAEIGRQAFDTVGGSLSWDWAPSPATSMSLHAGYQSSRLQQANVNDNENLILSSSLQTDPNLRGPYYPYANRWTAADESHNVSAGAYFRHVFSPRLRFDLAYDFTYSHAVNRYQYRDLGAVSAAYRGILNRDAIGNRFPGNIFRRHELIANFNLTLSADVGLRLFCKYQRGQFADWHYAGFDQPTDLVIGNRVFTDLGPQAQWSAMVVGAFVTVRL